VRILAYTGYSYVHTSLMQMSHKNSDSGLLDQSSPNILCLYLWYDLYNNNNNLPEVDVEKSSAMLTQQSALR